MNYFNLKIETFKEGVLDHLLSVEVKTLVKVPSKYCQKWSFKFSFLESEICV